jgi:hypothetical protein
MPDSSAIDQAVMDALLADPALRALLPDGVFWENAGKSLVDGGHSTRFVIVSLVDAIDASIFEGRASEDCLYAVKAVILSSIVGANPRAAAARIDALLELGTLTIPGYGFQVMRRRARIRMTEVDDVDTSIRWFHRGGHYQVMAAPTLS